MTSHQTAFVVLLAALATGCRTSGAAATVKDDTGGGGTNDFCVSPDVSLDSLKELSASDWGQIFLKGQASAALIPSADHPNAVTPGEGYPRIFSSLLLNSAANSIWGGKTMITDDQGTTRLYNRFVQASDNVAIDLFTARVVVDNTSKWRNADTNPIILLDYSQSTLTDPAQTALGSIDSFVVPVISAIRDEIRLVCQVTQNGTRQRLYLGPTFLVPGQMPTVAGKLLAQQYEVDPILWFALSFSEPVGR